MAYADNNQGRIPDNWNDLITSKNLSLRESKDHLYIKCFHSKYASFDSERIVYNYKEYKIAFGMKPEDILIQEGIVLKKGDGVPLLLIAPPNKTKVDLDTYRIFSKKIAHVMVEKVGIKGVRG